MDNSFLALTKNIVQNIERLDDLVDNYFEGVKDYTDTASDIFAPIKAIGALYTFGRKRKYKNFLKGYAKSLDEGNFTSLKTEKLQRYLKNEKNFNFLNDIIENAVSCKSIYGSLILGFYAGRILAGETEVNFKDLITIEVLKELNDYELSCFIRIYSVVNLAEKEIDINKYDKLKGYRFFCELTISKMLTLRALEKAPTRFDGGKGLRFISTEIAEDIYFLVKDIEIEEELIKYQL